MAEVVKFNEKNIAVFSKLEGTLTPGIYVAPAATDVTAATALTGSVTYTTGSVAYIGDSLSRDEYSYQTDSFADVQIDTPLQVLGALSNLNTQAAAPFSSLFQACGGFVTAINTATNGLTPIVQYGITVDNVTASESTVSMDLRKKSAQDSVNDKLTKFSYCRGMVDVTANVGDIPRLKFSMKGNAGLPEMSTSLSPNFQSQTTLVASTIRKQNMVAATLSPAFAVSVLAGSTTTATVTTGAAHGLASTNTVTISGATGIDAAKYNIQAVVTVTNSTTFTYTVASVTTNTSVSGNIMVCNDTTGAMKSVTFNTLAAPNFFGFDYTRYLTAAEEGFGKGGVPTDVTLGILEDQAAQVTATGIAFSGTVATVTTAAATTFASTNLVTISGVTGSGASATVATQALANLSNVAITVVTATSFTYPCTAPAGAATFLSTTDPIKVTNNSATGFAPDLNISNFFALRLKFGTGAGKYVTFKWNKLQLADVKESKIANLTADEIKFRNTGKSYIIFE